MIQSDTYRIFRSKSAILEFQDPTTTNALLSKAGVTNNNLNGYTMGEIADILGVEYLVQGVVSIQKTSVSTFNSTNSTSKAKVNDKARVDQNGKIIGDIWNSGTKKTSSSTFGSQTQNYSTNITMNIYTDKGENVYSKDHESFWQTPDAYKVTLSFLAKRSPLFKR
jgi:hypothetical protein